MATEVLMDFSLAVFNRLCETQSKSSDNRNSELKGELRLSNQTVDRKLSIFSFLR